MAAQLQFLWPFNSSCKLMKSGKSGCCVKLQCGAERNGPPSEAVSMLTSASWDWESWETILQSLQIEEFQTDYKGFFSQFLGDFWASLIVQLVKNLPAMWETWVWSLGWEDPLEEGMDNPHGQRILAAYSLWGHKELDTTEQLSTAQHRGLLTRGPSLGI